ncbi:hypothetical protein OPT61_g4383 [Boeremia exigua]|uniref:Uncharacterized protein n=1 Tax=Boeremia exigua TaxID=749465 RepID=A0ACC2IE94_9PLEO|nr:hypothetical protein OPT61_g4383 [Boeremia exigua]
MSRPSSIPSHGGPPSYQPYSMSSGLFSHTLGDQQNSKESSETQSDIRRLPSLRTLLEPELLDKPTDYPLRQAATQYRPNASPKYASDSPTLKRRHDFDSYAQEQFERNPSSLQLSYAHRPPPSHGQAEQQSVTPLTPQSAFSNSSMEQRLGRAPDSIIALPSRPSYDEEDPSRPVRRRVDALSRAPIRASRCVAQREMPGEGLCYIYEDGTYCRAVIDGEAVNPSWGITKAGKPRKRLAQACLTCREKKIKCEPGYPKCHQCTKSQRICRGGMNQPNQASTSSGSIEASPSNLAAAPIQGFMARSTSPSVSSETVNRIADLRENLRTADARHNGGVQRCRDIPPPSLSISARDTSVHSLDSDPSSSGNYRDHRETSTGLYHDHLALQWEQDPSELDPRVSTHILELYFQHAGRATYSMFPRRAFMSWAQSGRCSKSQDDRMLLYAVLAMGSLFSPDIDKRALGKRFAAVATYATEKRFGKFTLQLCQSRLLLALYHFAQGKSQEAWDFCGSGLRAISALSLNTEEGVKELASETPGLEYGFDRQTFEECCRRTFWSGFLMDRYNGFFGGTLFVVSIEDAFVRLPCVEDTYESGTPCNTPLFNYELLNRFAPKTPALGLMSYLCLISALWGDVLTFTGRAARRPDTGYEQHYEPFYTTAYGRLEGWHAMLPANLRYSRQNLENSIADGTVGTFMSLHALYHATAIRLNRQIRISAMPADKRKRNIECALQNASTFLSMMHTLASVSRQRRNDTPEYFFSTPFPGYALMLSIDVITSAGTFTTLPQLIDTVSTTMSCIEDLATFWASARAQQRAISNRLRQLTDIALEHRQGANHGHGGRFWKIPESLDVAFGKDDAIYRSSDYELFEVFG